MEQKFDAVAFDVDGTLYPNYRFYLRLLPFIVREAAFLLAFGKARTILRAERDRAAELLTPPPPGASFYRIQAGLMAKILKKDVCEIEEKVDRLIYKGWEELFCAVRLFSHVRETIQAFRERGLKTALLSDFPLRKKVENLKISGLWDIELCSEEVGMLKPDVRSFAELEKRLAVPAHRILFVGNSIRCDIAGAKNAGLQAALISRNPLLTLKARRAGEAQRPDFIFSAYRQLKAFVLE
ncbi:MAG: HAD family hydrolase [Spirochaetaceae bacterium]|nr:HAD family hydrolase [Spirochaetaceae bacterium]